MNFGIWLALGAVTIIMLAAGCTASGNINPTPTPSANSTYPTPVPRSDIITYIQPYCAGKSGPDMDNCTINQAESAKDVAVCTALDTLESRNTCITTWCGSASRDYKSCYRIADLDDQLLCLSKCNPNQLK